jgi:hypothetical protein
MRNLQKMLILGLMATSVSACASVMAVSDYCLVTDPSGLSIEQLAVYDCLCHPEPIDPVCR